MASIKERIISFFGIGDGDDKDNHSLLLILIMKAIVGMVAISEFMITRPGMDLRFLISGILIFLVGMTVRILGHISLGRHFRIAVKIVHNHKLIKTGIYKHVRHPMYTGLFLMVLGSCIALHSWFGVAATLVLLVPAGLYRVYIEEHALTAKFGEQYKEYKKKTNAFVPFIW